MADEDHKNISLYLPNTVIKDYGYPESHPLHTGNFGAMGDPEDVDDEDINSDDDYGYLLSAANNNTTHYHSLVRSIDDEDDDEEMNSKLNDDNDYIYNGDDDGGRSNDEINCRARALFDFQPENDNEVALTEGQIIWISYRHGQGWLVAEDPESGENGLVPEEYVEIFYTKEEVADDDVPKPFLPELLQNLEEDDSDDADWVDTDYDEDEDEDEQSEDEHINEEADISDRLHDVKLVS
ncbi:protein that interacts with Nap1, which is involved in histone assembly [Scheffersomyces stipitis CBS 6054]|uniref:Protein that interacts with Nap1, which is involved in histone assembly n=1 Tax=Scheffersomyces stipitis (strain ATCC 58785 / CBS 6054 / NBRC 10063 / NRRL Y-11545) TaxID=322104 RepID=A3LPG6_PICST|nr:protein that interacts with Nap1, which is involved in histone assembly [Scheffersomyces stipitis CBS 6054]ABN65041.1 protein that interacts with Nap1, which is involved in histone assembly [Scheffersomyces stipitis CBS 6054]KAG2736241.1 hypothetical protein G9P44_000331 [Scheffersomyces stipitis]